MLRTLAKGLILWDDVSPTQEWIDSHVPVAIRRYCMVRPEDSPLTSNIDYETINQVVFLPNSNSWYCDPEAYVTNIFTAVIYAVPKYGALATLRQPTYFSTVISHELFILLSPCSTLAQCYETCSAGNLRIFVIS